MGPTVTQYMDFLAHKVQLTKSNPNPIGPSINACAWEIRGRRMRASSSCLFCLLAAITPQHGEAHVAPILCPNHERENTLKNT